jgi:hypothetical protein
MTWITQPRNIFEIPSGATKTFRIKGYEPNPVPMTVTSSATGEEISVQVLRLYISEEDGKPVDKELNIVSKRLMWLLKPYLGRPDLPKLLFTVTKTGVAPKAEYSLAVS